MPDSPQALQRYVGRPRGSGLDVATTQSLLIARPPQDGLDRSLQLIRDTQRRVRKETVHFRVRAQRFVEGWLARGPRSRAWFGVHAMAMFKQLTASEVLASLDDLAPLLEAHGVLTQRALIRLRAIGWSKTLAEAGGITRADADAVLWLLRLNRPPLCSRDGVDALRQHLRDAPGLGVAMARITERVPEARALFDELQPALRLHGERL